MVGGRERGFVRGVGWTVTLVEEGQPVAPPHSRAIPWAPLRRPEISVGSWLGQDSGLEGRAHSYRVVSNWQQEKQRLAWAHHSLLPPESEPEAPNSRREASGS